MKFTSSHPVYIHPFGPPTISVGGTTVASSGTQMPLISSLTYWNFYSFRAAFHWRSLWFCCWSCPPALVFAVALHLSHFAHVCSSIVFAGVSDFTFTPIISILCTFRPVFARRGYSSRSSHKVTELAGVCGKIIKK